MGKTKKMYARQENKRNVQISPKLKGTLFCKRKRMRVRKDEHEDNGKKDVGGRREEYTGA